MVIQRKLMPESDLGLDRGRFESEFGQNLCRNVLGCTIARIDPQDSHTAG